ncbi:MAG: glycosyltransferase family 9 protein [Chloroflexota bacterium]|nr:glycosyltransferase family 9 protein [Chloroflexota bacterium]MDE2931842.1 glycosyltransferase family 9 protein [Chloroflexota bacterium]
MENEEPSGAAREVPYPLPSTLLPRESVAKRWLRRGFLRTLSFLRPYRFPATHLNRILVIRPDHIGDVLLVTPALRLLRQAFPDSEITALVGPWSEAVLANNPHVDRVLTCRFPGFDRSQPQPGMRAYRQLRQDAQRLRSEDYQLALNLREDFWWGAALAAFAGIPYVWGFDVPECAPFLTHAQPLQDDEHQAASDLRMARAVAALGVEVENVDTQLQFDFTPDDEQRAEMLLRNAAIPDAATLIAIHPGSGAPVKNWAAAGWHAVGSVLAQDPDVHFLVTAGPTEHALAEEVAAGLPRDRVLLVEQVSLGELAALYARCALVLGPDSGPLHLAVAVKTPSVTLYGASDPVRFGPWGPAERHRTVVSSIPCRHCGYLSLPTAALPQHPCMQYIEPAAVTAAAQALLAQTVASATP